MIDPNNFLEELKRAGITFYSGVPDSLLKDICACITNHSSKDNHIITANEGGAIGLAIGYHLATGQIPLVYLQNSGLGNSINPLLSLADREVYGVPMMLMIGWRGEPGKKDEPQHIKQGRVQNELLDVMEIDYRIIDKNTVDYRTIINDLYHIALKKSNPVALIVRKGSFSDFILNSAYTSDLMSREDLLAEIIQSISPEDIVVSTTGKASREIFEIREQNDEDHENDFLTVGGMGHCSMIAMGIAMQKPHRTVYCIDGDGAAIMHMGSMSIIGNSNLTNFKHILINNGSHDSVGGQPTVGFDLDFSSIAKGNCYRDVKRVNHIDEVRGAMDWIKRQEGPVLVEFMVRKGARANLGRPKNSPEENKKALMNNLEKI